MVRIKNSTNEEKSLNIVFKIRCNSVNEFLTFLSPWGIFDNEYRHFIFRGHSSNKYKLLPVTLRDNYLDNISSYIFSSKNIAPFNSQGDSQRERVRFELNLLYSFYSYSDKKGLYVPDIPLFKPLLASRFVTSELEDMADDITYWLPQEMLELAGLAQHYGVPTSLLDWTYDAYTAAYFASNIKTSNDNDEYLVVWALNQEKIRTFNLSMPDDPLFKIELSFIKPVNSNNNNLLAQQGLFTHTPIGFDNASSFNDIMPLDEYTISRGKEIRSLLRERNLLNDYGWVIDECLNDILYQINLPIKFKNEVQDQLLKMGYDSTKHFPGYTGIAKQVLNDYDINH